MARNAQVGLARRVIGLDVGSKRIGVAISDELGTLAQPRGVIRRRSYNKDAAAIAALVDETGADRIVIGLPVGLAGTATEQTLRVQRFGQMLEARVPVPVDWWDERLTTVAAQIVASQSGRGKPRRSPAKRPQPPFRPAAPPRGRLDELAAALILQGYLEFHRRAPAPSEDEAGSSSWGLSSSQQ